MIIRSFLITRIIPPKISHLGNGKMPRLVEKLFLKQCTDEEKWREHLVKLEAEGFRVVMGSQFTRVLRDLMNGQYSPLQFVSKCFFLAMAMCLVAAPFARAGESYITVEAYSGKILLELDADQKRPVASLTKIATAMVVLDWAALSKTSLAGMAVVPQAAANLGGSNPMGLIPGDQISLREGLYSMLLGSDNVAAYTLAEHVGRSIQSRTGGRSAQDSFVGEMNNLARGLGMTQTSFANPHGMDHASQRGTSTARDMARLGIYAMRDAGFQFYVKQSQRTISCFRGSVKRSFKVGNMHALVGKGDVNGIKSGNTVLAGACAATSSEKKSIVQKLANGSTSLTGRRLIVITLGSSDRWGMTQTLITQGWGAYEGWRQQGSPVTQARELLTVPTPQ
jgi:serine-type D-Ala-D-Ala carboxypeptidase (penicillin-binding protein 5/6)